MWSLLSGYLLWSSSSCLVERKVSIGHWWCHHYTEYVALLCVGVTQDPVSTHFSLPLSLVLRTFINITDWCQAGRLFISFVIHLFMSPGHDPAIPDLLYRRLNNKAQFMNIVYFSVFPSRLTLEDIYILLNLKKKIDFALKPDVILAFQSYKNNT